MTTRRRFTRSLIGALSAVFVLSGAFFGASSSADAATDDAASSYVKKVVSSAFSVLQDESVSKEDRAGQFMAMFKEFFDVPGLGKKVIGPYWRNASEEEKAEFLALFEEATVLQWLYQVQKYATSYDASAMEVLGAETSERSDITQVLTKFKDISGGPAIELVWRVAPEGETFKINDIAAEGALLSKTYSAQYRNVIRRGGGSLNALNGALKKQISQLRDLN